MGVMDVDGEGWESQLTLRGHWSQRCIADSCQGVLGVVDGVVAVWAAVLRSPLGRFRPLVDLARPAYRRSSAQGVGVGVRGCLVARRVQQFGSCFP